MFGEDAGDDNDDEVEAEPRVIIEERRRVCGEAAWCKTADVTQRRMNGSKSAPEACVITFLNTQTHTHTRAYTLSPRMHWWLMACSGCTLPALGHGPSGLHKRHIITIAASRCTLRSHHPERGRVSQEQDHARDAAKAKERLEDDSYLGCEAVEGDGR